MSISHSTANATLMDSEESFAEAERQFKNQYDITEVLGEGTYGKVRKARCRQTGEFRALKQMKLGTQEDGVPSTAIREIAILKELAHENIVRLIDVFCKPGELVLVFELLDSDLKKHMKALNGRLQPGQVRDFGRQLLKGIEFCHMNRIIHRDLKPQNLLIDSGLRLKIADFGLARAFMLPVPQYTHEVVTVWYRPLEILLGSKLYSVPVDLWGVGCILAEMATGSPLFAGDSEIDTAFKIFQKLGTPTEAVWPGVSELPDFKPTFPKWTHKGWANIRNTQAQVGASGIDILDRLMRYNPRTRVSARQALQHPYFLQV
jgi:serine/threonine protein kinase